MTNTLLGFTVLHIVLMSVSYWFSSSIYAICRLNELLLCGSSNRLNELKEGADDEVRYMLYILLRRSAYPQHLPHGMNYIFGP